MSNIKRDLQSSLLEGASQFRTVTLLDPRQAGKTTLAKMTIPEHNFASLEDLDLRSLAEHDPNTFLSRFKAPVMMPPEADVFQSLAPFLSLREPVG